MELLNKTVVITGGASGIGAAMAQCFADAGAKIVIGDLQADAAKATAAPLGGIGVHCDVTKEADIQDLVKMAEDKFGPVDMFVSNAGLAFGEPDHAASASNADWQTCWDVHVMSHVYAARTVLPGMIERGEGYLLQMASAAGLLSQIGDAAYSTTKHAAVAFAESVAITHGDQGIKVSVICPQYVATPLIGYSDPKAAPKGPGVISVADATLMIMQGIEEERFLILTHEEVAGFMQLKASDYDRWLSGMRKLRNKIIQQVGSTKLKDLSKLF